MQRTLPGLRAFDGTGLRAHLLLLSAVAQLFVSACAAPGRLPAVPVGLTTQADTGFEHARFLVAREQQAYIDEAIGSIRKEQAYLARSGHRGPLPPADFLAISGGGDDGAFGAGLLTGWTEAGNRPVFKAVTGVSTGALIAPFAFLGPRYDPALRHVYTSISRKDIFKSRGVFGGLFSDAMADTTPMAKLIERYTTPQMLEEIAAEYEKGRLLFIGTTNLDSREPVIWNMTAIAASGKPEALKLFRRLLLASAAIPGAFPPVLIDVRVDGTPYQELHVDGGAMAQVFLYPPYLHVRELSKTEKTERQRRLFIIRNARLDPDWASVKRRTLSVASRAITSLIHTQGLGDLYRIYLISQRDGIDYNLAFIPPTFNVPHEEEFDTNYMQHLFDTGYQMGKSGYPWQKRPPGM